MNNWIRVGDLIKDKKAHSQTGPFGTQLSASEYAEEGIPVINVRNIGMGDIRADNVEYIDDKKAIELKSHSLKEKDIVFGRKGAVERHSLITLKETGWVQGSDCIRLRFFTDEINPIFISYFFRTQRHQQWMINLGSFGATMGSLNQSIISKIEIPDIDRKLQDKIASILSAYDDLIENNNQRIKLLEEMAEEIYKEWFVRLRFPGYQECNYFDKNGTQVERESEGALPEGWRIDELTKIVSVSDGTHDSPKQKDSGHFLVTGKNIIDGFIDTSQCYFISKEDHQKIQKRSFINIGDTIISNIGTVGNTAFIFEAPDFSVKNVILLRPRKNNYSNYIYSLVKSTYTLKVFLNETSGSSQQFLSLNYMRKFKILIPTDSVLVEFENKVKEFNQLRYIYYKKNQLLQETRDLLLPRLISGKLSVEGLITQRL